MKRALLLVLLCVAPASADYLWRPIKLGGGGWLTGMDFSVDGTTKVVRTDTYGGYVLDGSTWRQLVTSTSMPGADVVIENQAGLYELRVAPNTPATLYMNFKGGIYQSTDTGHTWTKTAFTPVVVDANDAWRMWGEKMAVDPLDANHVLVGTPLDGLFRTTDGGANWSSIASFPQADETDTDISPGITGIVFDAGSTAVGGRTGTVYASSYGNGIYRSTDAGATWSLLASGPTHARHAVVSSDHIYYAGVYSEGVWKYDAGWTHSTPTNDSHSIALDPNDAAHVVMASDGGHDTDTVDRGANWIYNGTPSLTASDVPWQEDLDVPFSPGIYLSNGNQIYDPVTANKIWMSAGTGVWHTTLTAGMETGPVWTSQTAGIENLVANTILSPPGGVPILASWDRPFFRVANPDVYPSSYGPAVGAVSGGWAVDYVASQPSFLVGIADWNAGPIEDSGTSSDGGLTWTDFPTVPAWSNGVGMGTIAASTTTNYVWVATNKRAPYYTTNGGTSWTKITLPGVEDTEAGWTGLHFAFYLDRHVVAADRVTAGTFYLYHSDHGLFRSTDGGANWTLRYSGAIAPFSGFNAKLKSVPGKAGHLFFTSGGLDGGPDGNTFMHSTDGGQNWSAIANVLEVWDFGFGKEATPGGYPALFLYGWVSGVLGMWRSYDEGATWTFLGNWPLGSFDAIKAVSGDMNVVGKVYVGFAGSGYAYGTPYPTLSGGASLSPGASIH